MEDTKANWFLVEIVKPMSTKFKKEMQVWCRFVSSSRDFELKTLDGNNTEEFKCIYLSHFKRLH